MKKILLAGATGYLGSHIAAKLIRSEYALRVIVRSTEKLQQLELNPGEVFQAEITRPEKLRGCCSGVDTVISTVGITRQKDGLTYMDVDYQANLNLLNEARDGGG